MKSEVGRINIAVTWFGVSQCNDAAFLTESKFFPETASRRLKLMVSLLHYNFHLACTTADGGSKQVGHGEKWRFCTF